MLFQLRKIGVLVYQRLVYIEFSTATIENTKNGSNRLVAIHSMLIYGLTHQI